MAQNDEVIVNSIRYRRHVNGGGLVAETAKVAPTVRVAPMALVYGNARLTDYVQVTGTARVGGNVVASGHAVFCQGTDTTEGTYSGSKIISKKR